MDTASSQHTFNNIIPLVNDTDSDGKFDAVDSDIDNDTVGNALDGDPFDPAICQDTDSDSCDDCSVELNPNPLNDGLDSDADGACDNGGQ